jgi:hypothetical protein
MNVPLKPEHVALELVWAAMLLQLYDRQAVKELLQSADLIVANLYRRHSSVKLN